MAKIIEFKKKSESELMNLLKEKRSKIRLGRFNMASARIKNVRELRTTKREIAQIFTLLNLKKKHVGE